MIEDARTVGREQDTQRVVQTLRAPQARGICIIGDPGVGKTRLARDALLPLEQQGNLRVYRTQATEAVASIPYGAVADLLPDEPLSASAAPLDVMRGAIESIRERSGSKGTVIAVDDAHLLDAASAALLHHVVRAEVAKVLVTLRRNAPVQDAIVALWLQDGCERIELAPLTAETTAELVDEWLGAPCDVATAHRLWSLSSGNPLLLRELVIAGQASASLVREDDRWRAVGPIAKSPRLVDIVRRRLDGISVDARATVDLLALGGPLELTLLETLCGAGAVVEAEQNSLVSARIDGRRTRVVLSQPLSGEVLRSEAGSLQVRQRFGHLSEWLASTDVRRKDDLLRLTCWRLEAGDRPNRTVLLEGSRRALALGDATLALRLAKAAHVENAIDSCIAIAEALQTLGRAGEAEELLAGEGFDAEGRVAMLRAGGLLSGFGRATDAAEVLDRGAEGATVAAQHELQSMRVLLRLQQGRIDDAAAEAVSVLTSADAPRSAQFRALLVSISAWAQQGEGERAAQTASSMLELLETTPATPALAQEMLRLGLCLALGLLGRYEEAEMLADRQHLDALEHVAEPLHAAWTAALGHLCLARGDLGSAQALLADAVAVMRTLPAGFGVYSLAWCLGCMSEVAAVSGDAAAAARFLDEADAATPEPSFIGNRELGRIWSLAAQGRLEGARAHAYATADEAAALGNRAFEAAALHAAVRLGDAERSESRLRLLAERIDGRLSDLYADHALALTSQDPDLLMAVSVAFEDAGRLLLAAEAAAECSRIHTADARYGSANFAALRARALAERCGGARTPALVFGLTPRPLTAREREVTAMAAQGLTSRMIGERLFVSIRTVDNHLQRAYDKLGVRSREKLSAVLRQLGEVADG